MKLKLPILIITIGVLLTLSFSVQAQSLPTITMDKPIKDMTISELQAKIAEILSVIQQLQALIAQLQGGSVSCNFYRNLYPGVSGSDVKCLQQYLNNTGHTVANSGPGSSNQETIYYGSLTRAAVKKWQDANNIEQGAWWGYFGPKSQAIYNELAVIPGEQSPYVPPEDGTSEDKAGTYCGDNIAQRPSDQGTIEDCDGIDTRNKTCLTQGYTGGTLSCSNDCSFNTSQCTGAGPDEPTPPTPPGPTTSCGDSIMQKPNSEGIYEVCDRTNLGTSTCLTYGYPGGTLSCSSDCITFNTTNCITALGGGGGGAPAPEPEPDPGPICGNNTDNICPQGCTNEEDTDCTFCGDNILQRPNDEGILEVCDTTKLNNQTCITKGYTGGTLQCSNTCLTFDTSSCTSPGPENQAPVLNTIGDKSIDENQQLLFTVSGTDPDNDTLTYSIQDRPSGAAFNTTTRTFTWTPLYTQSRTYQTTFTVSDGSLTDTETITIIVYNVNRAPILNSIGNKTVDENQELSFTVSGTDIDGDTLYYSILDSPSGASFNSSTRTFTWTPSYEQQGTYTPTFIVSDTEYTDTEAITITVNDVCVSDTCSGLGYECETWGDGCGGILDCGTCDSGYTCESGLCVEETPEPYCGDSICNGTETCSTCSADCGECPEEIAYYVRPAGGSYGLEDGSSYENAWDGLMAVVWDGAGIVAGDTLYVCGTHINTYKSGDLGTEYYFTPGATGTEADPITIKGCPGDPAIIWNAYIDKRNNGIVPANWTGPVDGVYYNETGIYAKIFTSFGLYENINGASYDRYTKLDSVQEVTDYNGVGVYYKEAFGTNQHKIWLKPFESSTFKENIRFSGYGGYYLQLGDGKNYIEYQDIDFIGGKILDTGTYHHYTFTNCSFLSYGARYIYDPSNASYITFDNCEFAYGGNGIYVIWNHGDIHHIYVKNSYFHDIGNPFLDGTTDGHAIGIQNNEYFYISGNTFERSGSAIVFHVGALNTQRHLYITGNFISDMRASYGNATPGYGIVLQGSNNNPKGNTGDMLIAYNIVTNNEGPGISTTRKDFVNIYNNVVHSSVGNYKIVGARSDGASARFYNNISLFPKLNVNPYTGKIYGKNHVYFNQNYPDITYDFEADNNIYYPDADVDGSFYFISGDVVLAGVTFTQWKTAHLDEGDVVDTNSYTVDPLLSNLSGSYSNPSDFNLQSSSPAIDAGIDVGLTLDYEGNPIPQGLGPDIGVYEYGASPVRISQTDEKINNLASVLSGIQSAVQDILKRIQELF